MAGFDAFTARLTVSGELEAITPLRIGAGRSTDAAESDLPVLKDVFGRPLIPGSSLKGALRSHLEAMLRAVQSTNSSLQNERPLTCDVLDEEDACLKHKDIEALKKHNRENPNAQVDIDTVVLNRSCLTCRLFGSPHLAGKLAIRDLPVDKVTWGGRYMLRDGVAIDRDTGTADDRKKYDLEAVPAGTRFVFEMQVDNVLDPVEQGLALLAVRALETEQVQIGGGRSRGLGWCRLIVKDCQLHTDPVAYLLGEEAPLNADDREARIAEFRRRIGR